MALDYHRVGMKRRLRILLSLAVGASIATLLPVYPWRSMTRSMVIGHAGDVISYDWSLNRLVSLLDKARYHGSPAPLLCANAALFLLLSAAFAIAVHALLKRRRQIVVD
jgi:hypothetical protein